MRRAGLTAILVAALVLPAAAQPAPCPGGGFDAVGCDVDRVTAAAACAPRGVRALVRTALRRVGKRVASAERADAEGEPHAVALQLGKAGERVAGLARRLGGLRARGRLPDGCAGPMLDALGAVDEALTALRAGPATTTTTIPTTASTVTTSSTLGAVTTTSSTTTTVPTCGNGQLDRGEQCDGTNLFGRTCLSLGFHGGGQLMCHDCLFDNHDCRF